MANQPIVCLNVLCKLFKQEQWNEGFIENKENAPWDNYPCPECGGKTEPFWIIEYHYQIPGMRALEQEIIKLDTKLKALKRK